MLYVTWAEKMQLDKDIVRTGWFGFSKSNVGTKFFSATLYGYELELGKELSVT